MRRPITHLLLAAVSGGAALLSAGTAAAQTSPRVLVIFDTSGSMLWDYPDNGSCGGDGSIDYPHRTCQVGSKMFHAKAALSNVVVSTPDVQFGLMRYHQLEPGDPNFGDDQLSIHAAQYTNAAGQMVATNYDGMTPGCVGADLLVEPSANSGLPVLSWMDGIEAYPLNKELRANGFTPLTDSLNSATDEMRRLIAADPESACRPYFVLLLTDGYQQCPGADAHDPNVQAQVLAGLTGEADNLRHLDVGGREHDVRTYVVGFGQGTVFASGLDALARSGGTAIDANGNLDLNNGVAYQANDPQALARALQSAVDGAELHERCDGADNDCDGQVDEDFALGQPCHVGQGACARDGQTMCSGDGDGTVCSVEPGDPQAEICNGIDDDCDGQIDEGLMNACGECGPEHDEVCNGVDDNCNGEVDEGMLNRCGRWASCPSRSATDRTWDPLESTCRHASLSIL